MRTCKKCEDLEEHLRFITTEWENACERAERCAELTSDYFEAQTMCLELAEALEDCKLNASVERPASAETRLAIMHTQASDALDKYKKYKESL